MQFRPDIEGLRGFAVLLVVVFHAFPGYLPGGYIGVDVFFVISGFLIARMVDATLLPQRDSIATFYLRRIKRLLPAMLVVITATFAVCWLVMLPDDLLNFMRSIRETLLIRSNRFFERETTAYFATAATEMPLLHTWSLSIEWQFYLLFPVVFLALRLGLPRLRLAVLGTLTTLLLALSIVETSLPGGAYFLASARAFEFVLGATIAHMPPSRFTLRWARTMPILGVVGLLMMAAVLDASSLFPGVNAFVVCALAAACIHFGEGNACLQRPALVLIGRRSYSIYLWHWPVLALAAYVWPKGYPAGIPTVVLLALIAGLSELTYRFVEQPGIRLKVRPALGITCFWLLPLATVSAGLSVVRSMDGIPERLGPEAQHVFETLKRFHRDREKCNDMPAETDVEQCAFGDPTSSVRGLLLGDSHAQHYWAFVDTLAKDANLKVYGLTNGECLALKDIQATRRQRPDPYCTGEVAKRYAMIEARQYRYIFLAQRWIGYPEAQLELLDRSLKAIVDSGAIPVVLQPVAEDGQNASQCFFTHIKLQAAYRNECGMKADNDFAVEKKRFVADLFARMASKYPTAIFVDPQRVQCNAGECLVVIDGVPVYSDLHHLTDYGAESLARRYLARVSNPLRNEQHKTTSGR